MHKMKVRGERSALDNESGQMNTHTHTKERERERNKGKGEKKKRIDRRSR